jgi:hypothetical protein
MDRWRRRDAPPGGFWWQAVELERIKQEGRSLEQIQEKVDTGFRPDTGGVPRRFCGKAKS